MSIIATASPIAGMAKSGSRARSGGQGAPGSARNGSHIDNHHTASTTMHTLRIQFISDVVCPWCALGLASLEKALQATRQELAVHIRFEPFELNPDLPAEGEDIAEHLMHKYALSAQQVQENQENIRARGAALGFAFRAGGRERIWNTLDAHRLLYFAAQEGEAQQMALKKALFKAYFTEGKNPAAPHTLARAAQEAGLDAQRAQSVIQGDEFAPHVKARLRLWSQQGIHAVPTLVINEKHLLSGAHPPEYFAQALRKVGSLMETSACGETT